MDKDYAIHAVSTKMRLIRHEKGYTQEKMAEVLGISKKTLVQIEKERTLASWTCIIAVCAVFRDSVILRATLGEDPLEVIETLAHERMNTPKEKTLGGKVWWKQIEEKNTFILQQNVISKHYRIIDSEHYRWFSSFDEGETREMFETLAGK